MVNTNTYQMESYVDFNTQQTEYISLRYLSISPPFVMQNLLPAPITLLYHNIPDRPGIFDLDLPYNSQLQVLSLNPLDNFEYQLIIPGYEASSKSWLRNGDDEDVKICEEIMENKKDTSLFRFIR